MRHILLISLVFLSRSVNAAEPDPEAPLRVLMTVGGVAYHTAIQRNLAAMPEVELTIRDIDQHPTLFLEDALASVDAILMYHRDNEIGDAERTALLAFVERGGGVVVLHHALANYPDWTAWWRDLVGGLYVVGQREEGPPSRYFLAFEGAARPLLDHPVTQPLGSIWRYQDESYSDLWLSPDVTPLLQTTAFGSDQTIAWIGPSETARIVYIQPGHGARVMGDEKYLGLLAAALRWVAN